MAIIRNTQEQEVKSAFSVGLNVVLIGSKKMTAEEQDKAVKVAKVRVLIVDDSDPKNILVDETVDAREFSTGSVGYGLNIRSAEFSK